MAKRAGRSPEDFVPRRFYRYHLDLHAVVDLAIDPASLPDALSGLDFSAADLSATQAVGDAAQHLGREAVRAPSATGVGDILAVFIDRLQPESVIEPIDFETWEAAPN